MNALNFQMLTRGCNIEIFRLEKKNKDAFIIN